MGSLSQFELVITDSAEIDLDLHGNIFVHYVIKLETIGRFSLSLFGLLQYLNPFDNVDIHGCTVVIDFCQSTYA